ncbi:DUF6056 family protein [Clostridium butyricum]
MKEIKNKFYRLQKNDSFPFLILLFGMLLIHLIIRLNYGDDLYFKDVLSHQNLIEWLRERYMTWSSRLIIEAVMVSLLTFYLKIWNIIDVLIILLLGVSIAKVFTSYNKKTNWIIVCMIFIYPFLDMSSAGWAATTINYLWPLSFGIYSFVIIKKIYNNKSIKKYEYILSVLAVLFAANQEQMCAILLPIYAVITVLFMIKKKNTVFIGIQTVLVFFNIIFIFTCPGNEVRKISEIKKWFCDYNMLSFIDRVQLGYSSSIGKIIFQGNIIFVMLCLVILVCIFNKYKSKILRVISLIPLVSSVYCSFNSNFASSITRYGIVNFENYDSLTPYILIIYIGILCLCVLISIYFCCKDKVKACMLICIIIIGTASRMAIGFSPTIWASSDRTFLFMYFSFIIVAISIFDEIYYEKSISVLTPTIGILSGISYFTLIFEILNR